MQHFMQLKMTWDRYVSRTTEERVLEANRGAHSHRFKVGAVVYRQPLGMRDKRTHTLGTKTTGPYRVKRIISRQAVELEHMDGTPASPDPVPCNQLIVRNRRAKIELPEDAELKSFADVYEESRHADPNEVEAEKGSWRGRLTPNDYVAYILSLIHI